MGGVKRLAVLGAAMAAGLALAAPGYAAESFRVLSVNATGCNSGNFAMTVARAELDGGSYFVRTQVTIDGLVYMNESASISVNTVGGWNLFNNFSYGAVPNPGTWPMPQDRRMRILFTLERPVGTILYTWSTIVDSCNAGNILYNGFPSLDTDGDFVPTPRDRCPNLRATTLDGCPARTLTLGYDNAQARFIGWLTAEGFPSLFRHRVVTIWRARPGPDVRVGRARTTSRGSYSLARERRAGLYYAVAAAVGNVAREQSLNLRLR